MARRIYKLLKQSLSQTQWFCRISCRPVQVRTCKVKPVQAEEEVRFGTDKIKKPFLKSVPWSLCFNWNCLSPRRDKMSSAGTVAGQFEDISCFTQDQRPWPSYKTFPSERWGWRESRTLIAVLYPTPEPWKRQQHEKQNHMCSLCPESDFQFIQEKLLSLLHKKILSFSFTDELQNLL